MELAKCRAQLAQNGEAIRVLVTSVSQTEARWKPSAEEWALTGQMVRPYNPGYAGDW
jgi:hypothetical protein